jgi:hypothetical protein
MPDRILRSSLLTSPNFNRYSLLAQNLAVRLILVVDDLGRYHGTATAVRAACFPEMEDRVSVADVEEALGELCAGSDGEAMIERYQIKRRVFLRFVNWATHQRLRSKTSRFPDPETGLTRADQARDAARMRWHAAERNADACNRNADACNRNADACNRNADAPGIGDGIGDGIDPPLPPQGGVGGGPGAADASVAEAGGSEEHAAAAKRPARRAPSDWAMALAERIEEAQCARLPSRTRASPAQVARSAQEIERLHTCDGHAIETIEAVARWVMADERQGDGFPGWASVVQSGRGLREKWNRIVAQWERANGTHRGGVARPGAAGQKAGMGYTALQRERQRELEAALGEGVGIQRVSPVEPAPPALVGEPQGGAATSPPAGGDAGACGMAG